MDARRLASLVAPTVALVALVASPAGAGGGGGCREATSTEATSTEVTLRRSCFVATVTRVGVGDTVTFTNADPAPHTVTGAVMAWGDYDELREGEAVRHRFDVDGVYPYFCVLHPGMVGAVVVGDGTGPGPAADGTPVSDAAAGEGPGDGAAAPADDADVPVVAAAGLGMAGALVGAGAVALWRRSRSSVAGRLTRVDATG